MSFPDSNYPNFGLSPIPPNGPTNDGAIYNTKLNHEAYDVYVNEQYIGKKTLLVQGESLKGVDDFLRSRGITSFTTSLDGDHYVIHAEGEHAQEIANNIGMYLSNR